MSQNYNTLMFAPINNNLKELYNNLTYIEKLMVNEECLEYTTDKKLIKILVDCMRLSEFRDNWFKKRPRLTVMYWMSIMESSELREMYPTPTIHYYKFLKSKHNTSESILDGFNKLDNVGVYLFAKGRNLSGMEILVEYRLQCKKRIVLSLSPQLSFIVDKTLYEFCENLLVDKTIEKSHKKINKVKEDTIILHMKSKTIFEIQIINLGGYFIYQNGHIEYIQ